MHKMQTTVNYKISLSNAKFVYNFHMNHYYVRVVKLQSHAKNALINGKKQIKNKIFVQIVNVIKYLNLHSDFL
jgi:hypothetical protein